MKGKDSQGIIGGELKIHMRRAGDSQERVNCLRGRKYGISVMHIDDDGDIWL